MEYNASIWSYYPPNDLQFIDPLYAPYTRQKVSNGVGGFCETNTWLHNKRNECFHPEAVRRGWGTTFQLMQPTNPCPEGYNKLENGFCILNEPEFEGTFYTSEAFVPKYQYWDSYAPKFRGKREISQFDMKSINPNTGNFVVYHPPRVSKSTLKYGNLASKDSLLA